MNKTIFIICTLFASCANKVSNNLSTQESKPILRDQHVHITGKQLISIWKRMGIPFSRADYFYSDLDTILKAAEANSLGFISMAYVYSSEE